MQSAYLSAFRHFNSFRGDSSFKTWITRIVINHCLMHVRSSARRRHFLSLDDSGSGLGPVLVRDMAPSPEDVMQSAEVRQTLVGTVAKLPRPLRDALTLYAISGLSIAETAETLGLTASATRSRLFRARSIMRSELKHMRAKANVTVMRKPVVCSPAVLKKAS